MVDVEQHRLGNFLKYNTFYQDTHRFRKPELIRKRRFLAENPSKFDPREFLKPAREATRNGLTLVASPVRHMGTDRAADILREDMEARGPVKLTEVEAAQREIVAIAQKLAEEGTIILGSSAGEYV